MRFRQLKKQSKNNQKIVINQQTKFKIARIPDKIKAFITDMFMIYMPIIYLTAYVFMDGKDDFQASTVAPLLAVLLYALIDTFLHTKFGQTPGKKAYEIKVVNASNGDNISFFQALFRFFAFLLSATIILGLLVPFFRKDSKALHDLLARTIVIKVD